MEERYQNAAWFIKTPPITSITVNDTILRDVDIAESISESFSRVTDDLSTLVYIPIPITDVPDGYIISSEALELALSAINEHHFLDARAKQSP